MRGTLLAAARRPYGHPEYASVFFLTRLVAMKKVLLVFVFAIIAALACAGALFAFFPWKDMVGTKLKQVLEDKGFENVQLHVAAVGTHGATLRDIAVGADSRLRLSDLELSYEPRALWHGDLQGLTVGGLDLTLAQNDEGWHIIGLKAAREEGQFTIPGAPAIPFTTLAINDSTLHVQARNWDAALPFTAQFDRGDNVALTLSIDNPVVHSGAYTFSAGTFKTTLAPTADELWHGDWTLDDITLPNEQIPPLSAKGTLSVTATTAVIEGAAQSKNGQTRIAFTAAFDVQDSAANTARITAALAPWQGGTISARDIILPLHGEKDVRVNVQAAELSIDKLLRAMTGERVTATGTVGGSIPLTIGRDGSISPGSGELKADGNGTINMPAGLIPGDSEQIKLTQKILQDFQYEILSIRLEPDGKGGAAILFALEGRNPDVYEGRRVKLNVRLTGDVLDFIRQNVILLTKPESLLKQEQP